MVTSIPIGPVFSMTADIAYALPAVHCLLFVTGTPTLVQSNTVDFAESKAITLDANNEAEVAGGFIMCTDEREEDLLIRLRRA